jgi:hypothetical protein
MRRIKAHSPSGTGYKALFCFISIGSVYKMTVVVRGSDAMVIGDAMAGRLQRLQSSVVPA